jgi:tetratricopeptide (TPR) repeat protein
MTQQPGRGASARAVPDAIAQSLDAGRRHHYAGRLAQAEALYRQVLAGDPAQPDALHLLGMIAYQAGRHAAAVDLIDKALEGRPDEAEYHHDRGVVLQAQGRLDDALASYRAAIARAPAHADAHYNAGTVLQRQGRLDDAVVSYRAALQVAPDLAEAHNNLGTLLQQQGRVEDAVKSFERAVALQPGSGDFRFNLGSARQAGGDVEAAIDAYRAAAGLGHVPACNELGNALAAQGRLEDAARSFVAALERRPDFAEAHNNLGNVLLEMGALDAAWAAYARALALADVPAVQANVARLMRHPGFTGADTRVRALLVRALEAPWARPADLAPAAARVIAADARIAALLERTARPLPGQSPDDVLGADGLRVLGEDALLRALLTNAPLRDPALERVLVMAREALLTRAEAATDDATLELHAALARQCFINEYAWPQTDDEASRVDALAERVRRAVAQDGTAPAASLAAVATYRPLATCVDAAALRAPPSGPLTALIGQQIAEPLEERRLSAALPVLTPIDDAVSRRVQRQYEENPYPRWVGLPAGVPGTLALRLRQRFPRAALRPLPRPVELDILIAGCGTGQEAIETAEENPQARVLAIDLSAASLAYARRKSDARGVRNVEFAQADLLELGALERRFDVISSVGVLHHVEDSLAGWRVLCGLLRPGGVMQIGLYSAAARDGITRARRFVSDRGYDATAAGIRRARAALLADPAFAPLAALRDFHATSECRDLLFHVQERTFTLEQVDEALRALDLTLLGFVLPPDVTRAYAQRFADDPAATNLANWARFEAEHPQTFLGMYVMWLQKPSGRAA